MRHDHSLGLTELQALLTATQPWLLADWYATPLSQAEATALLAEVRHQPGLEAQLLSWIAGFWLKGDASMHYQTLRATQSDTRDRALVELIYGQLLTSIKREGAYESLAQGFKLAAPYLDADEYFVLMKRHELLAFLPTQTSPAKPQALNDLLTEAQVIKRLRKDRSQDLKIAHAHRDTLD